MKTKDLVELVKNGSRPIIKIIDSEGVIEGPDSGMIGRIIGVSDEDVWERGNSIVSFNVNFKEFESHNKTIAKSDWYDENGNPTLTWVESRYYEKESIEYKIYENYTEKFEYSDIEMFELVEDKNELLMEYLKSNSECTYVEWLERKLLENK